MPALFDLLTKSELALELDASIAELDAKQATIREQAAEIERLQGALKEAEKFISNGVEFGYITLPEPGDPALNTLPHIREALKASAK